MSDPIEEYQQNEMMFQQMAKLAIDRLAELDCPNMVLAFDQTNGQVHMAVNHKLKSMTEKEREVVANAVHHAIINTK